MRGLLNGKMIGTLAVILVLFMAAGVAEEERADASGQWKYALDGGGATIKGCVKKPSGALVIPDQLDGYPVTRIGYAAFELCFELTDVVIPDGITSIGESAFSNCWNLPGATIPASVTHIGSNPFTRCDSLIRIDVALNNPTFESIDGVLFDKSEKKLISYPGAKKGAYTIPEGTLLISNYAFYVNGGLTSVTIPHGVTSIGDGAFRSCHALSSVMIPDSVTSIGKMAFTDCPGLTSVTIPASVTRIGDDAFSSCGELILSVTEFSEAEDYAKENGIPYVLVTE